MPKNYQASDEDMDASMYGGAPAEPAADETPKESVDEENAEASQSEAVVSNKVLTAPGGPPPKEGDEIVVKVTKVYGDESSIIYAPKKEGGNEMPPEESGADSYSRDFEEMDKT